jgi:hypothetical protein
MATELSWSQLTEQQPGLAEAGRNLLYQFGVGLAFLATVRPDGGPRLHPFCPVLVEGRLLGHIIPSPKRADLHRDGRYALHSFPCEGNEDAFYLTGHAVPATSEELVRAAAAQFLAERKLDAGPPGFADGEFFEFLISRCLLTRTDGYGDWHPRHTVWDAGAAWPGGKPASP